MARARIIALDSLQQFAAVQLASDPGYDRDHRNIDNCAEFVLYSALEGGKVGHMVFHGRYSGTFAGSVAQANGIMAGLFSGAQWTALAAFISNTAQFTTCSIRDLNVENQPLILSTTGNTVGTSVSPALPSETAVVITKRTAFVGPAHRGRIYFPGFATNALGAGNVVAAATVTALNNWAAIISGVLTANGGYVFSIAHHSRIAYTGADGSHHDARANGTVPITTIAVRDNHWDTQRRRGLK